MRIMCFHLNQIGDLIFSLPALKCIRDSFPEARLISVVRPVLREILESSGLAHSIVLRNTAKNYNTVGLIMSLSAIKPDLAVVFSQSATCALLAYLSGAPRRLGFEGSSMAFLLNTRVRFHHPPSTTNNLRLVEAAGARITCNSYAGLVQAGDRQTDQADRLLRSVGIEPGEPVTVLAPATSGNRSIKEWTDEGFAVVGQNLASRGLRPVILGSNSHSNITAHSNTIVDLQGRTNISEVIGILARSSLLVGVDSGLLHLAGAIGIPVIGLYGPSNHNITGPQGEGHIVLTSGADCSPCVKTQCSIGRKCMIDVTPQSVIAAVDSFIDGL